MQFQWPMHLHGHLWKNNVETVAFMINPDQPHQKIDVAKRPTFRDESRFQMSLFCDFSYSVITLQMPPCRFAWLDQNPSLQTKALPTPHIIRGVWHACRNAKAGYGLALHAATSLGLEPGLRWQMHWPSNIRRHSGMSHPELDDYIIHATTWFHHDLFFVCFIQGAGATLKAAGRRPNVAGPTTGPGAKHLESTVS